MLPQALEDRHHDVGDRQRGHEPEDRNAPEERVSPSSPARGQPAGRHEQDAEGDFHEETDRPEDAGDERPGDLARGERPEDRGSDGRREDDRRGEGERQGGEMKDEKGASQEANSITTGATRPA